MNLDFNELEPMKNDSDQRVPSVAEQLYTSTNHLIRLLRTDNQSAKELRNSLYELRSRTSEDDYAKVILSIAYNTGMSREEPKRIGQETLQLFIDAYRSNTADALRQVLWGRPQYQMDRLLDLRSTVHVP